MRRLVAALLAAGVLGGLVPPATRAAADASTTRNLSWLAIGDSYSSGHGVPDEAGDCRQTSKAYGPTAGAAVEALAEWSVRPLVFAACSGHLVEDFYNGRRADRAGGLWEWAQQQGAPDDGRFDVVTMTFGGNDIGFADLLLECINVPLGWGNFDIADKCDTSENELLLRVEAMLEPERSSTCRAAVPRREKKQYRCALHIDRGADEDAFGSLVDFYRRVANRHLTSKGQLYVLGYPKLFAPSSTWARDWQSRCQGFTRRDADMLGRVADRFDRVLAEAVRRADNGRGRIRFVSVLDLFSTHELCGTADDWLTGLAVRHPTRSFHTDATGHAAEGAFVSSLVTCRPEEGNGRDRRTWGMDAVRAGEATRSDVGEHDPSLGLYVLDTAMSQDHEDLCTGAVDPYVEALEDDEGHGTHVAGTAGAVSFNRRGTESPVGRQRLNDVDIFTRRVGPALDMVLQDAGVSVGTDGAVTVAPHGRRIVANGSFAYGFEGVAADDTALRVGFDSGRVLPVFAAGNHRTEHGDRRDVLFPARFPFTVAVGSSDPHGERADHSHFGPGLDLLAPGTRVESTWPWRARTRTCRETGPRATNAYVTCAGTSMAAPLVSSIAAALWKAEPKLHAHQLMKRLLASTGSSRTDEEGYGVVDMHRAFVLDRTVPTIEAAPLEHDSGVAVRLRVLDDVDTHGVAPIDETYPMLGGGQGSYRLDFAEVPTSAVARVRWSVDGGPWHDLDIGGDGVQSYRQADGTLCQVCRNLVIGASDLALTRKHKLVVRAWDSSAKPDGPEYAEHTVELESPGIVERSVGSTTVLVVDRSSSMSEPAGAVTKMVAARGAGTDVVRLVEQAGQAGSSHRIGLVSFADGASLDAAPTVDTANILDRLQALAPSGSTDIGEALETGFAAAGSGGGSRSLLLLSDGLPTSGLDAAGILAGPVAQAKQAGVRIHAVAFGFAAQSDPALLEQIAKETGGTFGVAATPADLQTQLLVAEHATSGLVLHDGAVEGPAAFKVPRYAGSLRVTAIAQSQTPVSVVLTGPQGTEFVADARPSNYGGAGVAAVTVPTPPAGEWHMKADSRIRLLVSAQPRANLPDDRFTPPIDKEGRPVSVPTVPERGPAQYRAPGSSLRLLAAASGGAGGLLLALGAIGTLADRRRRRLRGRTDRRCPSCGGPLSRVDRFCGMCAYRIGSSVSLRVVAGPDSGRVLRAKPFDLIGREEDVTHCLGDASVSRHHARVEWREDGWHLVDLRSTAGVVVASERVADASLVDGLELRLGNTGLRVDDEAD